MTDPKTPEPGEGTSEILLYQGEDGRARIEVRLEEGTVWLTQRLMAELYQTTPQNITLHLKQIYAEGEIGAGATCKELLQVRQEGGREICRNLLWYNLDAILAVGYRVRSHRGAQFRRWASERLRDYLVKGFAMDDERLKEGRTLGADYFDELLERIRDIRASEKRFYLKLRDLFALAMDYDAQAPQTRAFYQVIQNKLHWAVTGRTAPEIVAERADASKPNMGLTAWKGAKVRRADVTVAKNYLGAEEIAELNRVVVMYLDYAEDQARRRKPLYMNDWKEKLDAFLRFNEREVLENPGRFSAEVAQALAMEQFEVFQRRRLEEEAARDEEAFEREARALEEVARKRRGPSLAAPARRPKVAASTSKRGLRRKP